MVQMRHYALSTTFTSSISLSNGTEQISHTFYNISKLYQLVKWYRAEITHFLQHFRVVYQLVLLMEWHKSEITHPLETFPSGVSAC